MTDLSAPLSRRRDRLKSNADRPARQFPVARVALALVALIAVGVIARLALVDDPQGGRPTASAEIAKGTVNPIAGSNSAALPATITADPEMFPAEELESANSIVDVPAPPGGLDPDLVEQTEYGPIPTMSGTGARPFDAYARPGDTPLTAGGKPLIAIIVSGLGLNLDGTMEAIDKLPEDVTLAFAPYGKTLERSVGAARSSGHEVFLEVPLEPFDYPDNDPGPDTLLTGQPPRDNLNKLFHVMSRFGGYVGLINNMGARFTASGADFAPMMEELGARGLGYLDDGSSNRSLAPQLAKANRVPFARVDMTLDANPARSEIMEQLTALEDKAKQAGSAIGIVSALPVSVETITEWARGLEEKGIEIVPASALMGES